MKSLITITFLAFSSVALAADEKPPADTFQRSPFEFHVHREFWGGIMNTRRNERWLYRERFQVTARASVA